MNEKNKLTNNIRYKKKEGITLIALIITIIVMLILAAITISVALNGGLFSYAGKAVGDTQNAIDKEQKYANLATGMTSDQLIAKYTSEGKNAGLLTNATLTTGTEVYITGVESEHFYVIETSNSSTPTVKLLAKYNVKTDVTPYAQSEINTNTVKYKSSDAVCYVEELIKDYVSGNGTTGGSANCKLNLSLEEGEEARLLLRDDLVALANGEDVLGSGYAAVPSWVKNSNYWTGTNCFMANNYCVDSQLDYLNNSHYDSTYWYNEEYYGVRPVIIVLKSRLSLVNE